MANVYMGTDVEDFIFGEGTTYESTVEESTEETVEESTEEEIEESTVTPEEMNEYGVIECVDEPEVAFYRITLENEMNYNAIMNAFMKKEFSVLESTGQEMVYESADKASFFNNIEATIKRVWAKIQGAIKKLIDKISDYVVYNRAFINKYKGKDLKKPETDREFTGFNFPEREVDYSKIYDVVENEIVVPKNLGKFTSSENAENYIEGNKERLEEVKNKMRKLACGKDTSADNFQSDLKIAFYGSEEREKLQLKDFSTLIKHLDGAHEAKNNAKKAYNSCRKSIENMIKGIRDAKKSVDRSDAPGAMKVAKFYTDALNSSISIINTTISMQTRAIMSKVAQDRAMAAFYVANQPKAAKEEKVGESAIDDLGIVLI